MDHQSSDLANQVKEYLNLVNPNIWVVIVSIWGGIIGFFSKISSGAIEHFTIGRFLIEMASSIFSGIVIFYVCLAVNMNELLIAALVGVAGHMGSSLLNEVERYFVRMFKDKLR